MVITKNKGEIVGFAPTASTTGVPGQFSAGLVAGPGQQAHEVDVPDDFNSLLEVPEKLHAQLRALLPKQ
jgi:hypothetical protein